MIRDATPQDRSRIRAIQLAALDEPWPELLDPAIEGPPIVLVTTATPDSTADGSTTEPGAARRPGDEPVGYAVAIPEGDCAYLAEFAVAAGYRRSGRGSALMDALCRRLADEGFEALRLTVKMGDEVARSFYDSQGFRVRSLLPHHYESGDGLQLVRSL
ncbi:GNAT family N-acetyltransferase [Halorientalis brevis]|uniref:GNAT family N-acetyltransferase n=1 Tax=Halorientalis brevis TaxID=1126241 RepID=A0ABD6C5S5_9EURY|nr:GNAT family N-acetyltransferase [Halorientalis brevis]